MPNKTHISYYDRLEVSPKASQETIKAAWKSLMLKHHPDKHGDPDIAAELGKAYACLSVPADRKVYDIWLGELLSQRQAADKPKRAGKPEGKPKDTKPQPIAIVKAKSTRNKSRNITRIMEPDPQLHRQAVVHMAGVGLQLLARSHPMLREIIKTGAPVIGATMQAYLEDGSDDWDDTDGGGY